MNYVEMKEDTIDIFEKLMTIIKERIPDHSDVINARINGDYKIAYDALSQMELNNYDEWVGAKTPLFAPPSNNTASTKATDTTNAVCSVGLSTELPRVMLPRRKINKPIPIIKPIQKNKQTARHNTVSVYPTTSKLNQTVARNLNHRLRNPPRRPLVNIDNDIQFVQEVLLPRKKLAQSRLSTNTRREFVERGLPPTPWTTPMNRGILQDPRLSSIRKQVLSNAKSVHPSATFDVKDDSYTKMGKELRYNDLGAKKSGKFVEKGLPPMPWTKPMNRGILQEPRLSSIRKQQVLSNAKSVHPFATFDVKADSYTKIGKELSYDDHGTKKRSLVDLCPRSFVVEEPTLSKSETDNPKPLDLSVPSTSKASYEPLAGMRYSNSYNADSEVQGEKELDDEREGSPSLIEDRFPEITAFDAKSQFDLLGGDENSLDAFDLSSSKKQRSTSPMLFDPFGMESQHMPFNVSWDSLAIDEEDPVAKATPMTMDQGDRLDTCGQTIIELSEPIMSTTNGTI